MDSKPSVNDKKNRSFQYSLIIAQLLSNHQIKKLCLVFSYLSCQKGGFWTILERIRQFTCILLFV